MDKRRIIENKIMFNTKCVLLVMGLLTAVPVVNHLLRDVYKLTCLWGFVCVVYLFVKRRENYWTKEYLLLFLFLSFYSVTILTGTRTHLINEIAMLGYMGVLFFVLTYCDKKDSKQQVEKEITIMSWILLGVTFVFSSICFLMFVFSISGTLHIYGNSYIYGMNENRLWGLYNPNTGGSLNFLSIISSLFLMKRSLKQKWFLVFNMILQVLCLILTQSRGATVCCISFVAIYLCFVKEYRHAYIKTLKNALYKFLVVVVSIFLIIGTPIVVKKVLAEVPSMVTKFEGEQLDNSSSQELTEHTLDRLDKKENNFKSFSTGRSDLWKIGLVALKDHTILGIGYRNIDDVLVKTISEERYKQTAAGGLHNVYITVLVSSGIVGFGIVCMYLLILIKKVFRQFIKNQTDKDVQIIFALIPAMLVNELVESRIFFGMNIFAVVFWIVVGYVCFYAKEGEKVDINHCTSV